MRGLLPSVALVAAACATGAPNPGQSDSGVAPAYAVRGADRPGWGPGWRAVLGDGVFILDSPTSAGWYRISVSERREEGGHRIVVGDGVSLAIDEGGCRIAAYRDASPDRIRLVWDGGAFEACGGARRSARGDPLGTHWELVKIGAEAAPPGRSPAATFSFGPNGWVQGTQACNDTGAPIGWRGGRFVHRRDGGGTTDMACGDPAASAFGRRFWTLMNHARTWRIEGERLYIALPGGLTAELRYLL